MTDMFDGPGTASGFSWEDNANRLLLIKPHAVEHGVKTSFGEKDAIRADIIVLDGPTAGEENNDVLVFPLVLQGQIRANVGTGRYNLGRLGQGEKKAGQKPPWKLGDPTDADKDAARAHLAKNTQAPF